MGVVMIVSVAMMVVMIIAQEERAKQIDTQTDHRDGNGLIEGDRHGVHKAIHTFVAD